MATPTACRRSGIASPEDNGGPTARTTRPLKMTPLWAQLVQATEVMHDRFHHAMYHATVLDNG